MSAALRLPGAIGFPRRRLAIGVVIVAYWMGMIDAAITNLGFGTIAGGLNVSIDEVTWISTAYVLAMAIAMPLAGWLAANLTRKWAFIGALAVFTAASLACALSGSLLQLTIARFIQGLGAGAMQPLASATLMDAYPKEELPKAVKIIGYGGMVGPLTAPLLGGFLLDNFPWPMLFLVNVPVGLLTLALASSVLMDQTERAPRSPFDWTALSYMATGLVAFQYVIQQGPREEWFAAADVTAAAVVAVVTLFIFVRSQVRSKIPFVDFSPLRTSSFTAGTLLNVVTGVGFTGLAFIVPLYFQQILGFDATTAGLGMLPTAIAATVGIQFASVLTKRFPPVLIALVGLGCVAFGTFWFCLLGNRVGFEDIILPRFIQGLGAGLTFVPLNLLIVKDLPRAKYDAGQGLTGVARQLGMSVGYAVLSGYLIRAQIAATSSLASHVHVNAVGRSLGLWPIHQYLVAHGWSALNATLFTPALFERIAMRDAALSGYVQTFFVMGMLFVVSAPPFAMFWRRSTPPRTQP